MAMPPVPPKGNPFAKSATPAKSAPESKKEDAGHASSLRKVLTDNGITGAKATKIVSDYKKTE